MPLPEKDGDAVRARFARMQEENPFLPVNQIICELLREDIIFCWLEPGVRLNEEWCAQRYTASRTTIRKAFDILLEEGWLKKDEGHGVKVSRLLREDYLELMEFRIIIEPAACRLAARNRGREDLKRLEKYVEMSNTQDEDTLYLSDSEFHRAVFAAGKNPYLIQAHQQVSEKMERARYFTVEDYSGVYADVYREHRAIFRAIRDGNEELAHKLGYSHMKMMLDSRIIRKPGELD